MAARTKLVVTERTIRTLTGPICARLASSEATSDETIITGIVEEPMKVAEMGAVRPGEPSLAISAAAAPWPSAMRVFCVNVHPPRLISATDPLANPAKSESSQPLEANEKSTGTTRALTFPPPEYRIVTKSGPL